MKIVGIDVGSYSVNVVELAVQSRGFQILSTKSLNIKPKNNPTDVDLEVIEYLRVLVSAHDQANTQYVVGLRQDRVAIRHKFFPYTEKIKISKTLPFELEDELPFAVENAVIDFKSIRHRGNEAEILACAALTSTIEKIVNFFKDVGVEIKILCPEGFALANLMENYDQPIPFVAAVPTDLESTQEKKNLELLLHLGHTHTLVLAFDNKRLVAARTLMWGGKNVTQAISLKYQLPFVDAQREMETKAFILSSKQTASFEAKVFSDTISASVKDMVRDLQLSLLEVRSELNADIESVVISGPVSQVQGLGPFLTQCLEVPTNRIKLWDRFAALSLEKNEGHEIKMTVALGLALEGLKKPRNPATNLLKGAFLKSGSQFSEFWKTHGTSVGWGAAGLVALFIWASLRAGFSEQLAGVSQSLLKQRAVSLAGLTNKTANERGVEKFIQQKKQVATEMKNVEKIMQTDTAFSILKKVSDFAPSSQQIKLDVRRFYVEDRRVWLEGFVRSQSEVTSLQQSLKALAQDGKIQSQRASIMGPKDRVVFAFSFLVNREKGKD